MVTRESVIDSRLGAIVSPAAAMIVSDASLETPCL
jgi:hypothetical protein